MKNEDFKCERCKQPATRLSLSADAAGRSQWICPACALAEKEEAGLNDAQCADLEQQLVERGQLVRRRAQAQRNFRRVEAEVSL